MGLFVVKLEVEENTFLNATEFEIYELFNKYVIKSNFKANKRIPLPFPLTTVS